MGLGSITRGIAAVVASALVTSGVVVGATVGVAGAQPGGVVISEIHYHAGSDLDTDDFIELANTAATPIDVSGWSFTQGITATLPAGTVIPAGGRIVLSPDAARFALLYGFAPDAVYTGKLSNSGELVELVDATAAVVDQVSYLDASPWPGTPDGTGPSLELRDLWSDNTLPESWAASTVTGGTPRARNSVEGVPTVTAVTATPARPTPGQAVTITARMPVGATASLTYKVMFAADVVIPLRDDAASPGGAADGVYAATIPGQTAGKLIRYRIDATSGGTAISNPDPSDSIRYLGVVVTNPAVVSNLPVIEWFMDDAVYNDLLANHRYDDVQGLAILAYNGTVYDNARMNVRGNSSRSFAKVNWKVEMPVGHELDMGSKLPYTLDEFAIQRDPDAYADLSWATIAAAGARSLSIQAVRTQRNGAFWSVGRLMEVEDGTWRKAQGVDSWAIYKGDGGSLSKTSSPANLESRLWLDKKTRKTEDYSDVWGLTQAIDAPVSAAQKEWMYQNLNIPELVNYMAINSVIRHTDSGWYNWFIARDTEGTGRWEMWHWDVDYTFTIPARDGKGTFLTPDTSNKLTIALLAYPEIKEMFFRRLRTLADTFLPPPRFENQWDAITQPYTADWNLDIGKWGGLTPAEARGRLLDGLADRRNVIASNTGAGKPVPPSQSAQPNVVINEIQYAPAGGDAGEYLELVNPSTTESVDLSGWTIDGVGLTIQPGTVLLPKAHVVFVANDKVFRQVYGPANRFVGGRYTGDLSNTGETITLRQGSRIVDQVTYAPTSPWPSAANGTGPSLELKSPTADNSLPESWIANPAITGTPGTVNSVPVPVDSVPPTAPGALNASNVTQTALTLGWTASTDANGVTGYQVTRNGVVLPNTVTGLTFTDTLLAPATTYTYTVRALDPTGNLSPPSNTLVVTTLAPSSSLFSDSWSGGDGSAWSTGWTSSSTTGTVDTQGGAGRLAFNDTSGAFARAQLTGVANRADSEVVFSYRWSSTAKSAYFSVNLRGSGGWLNAYRPRNGYGVEFSAGSTTATITKAVNGTTTELRQVSGAQQASTAKQWVRLRVVGSTIQLRTWVDGQAEPTTWRSTDTDTGVTAPGQLFLSLARGSSNSGVKNVLVDDLTVRDGS
jgi:chitodextrinase